MALARKTRREPSASNCEVLREFRSAWLDRNFEMMPNLLTATHADDSDVAGTDNNVTRSLRTWKTSREVQLNRGICANRAIICAKAHGGAVSVD